YRSATRTASSALRRYLPAPIWETETCFCSWWTATAISTIPRTAPSPVCSADSFSGTVMWVPPPLPWICFCSASSAALHHLGAPPCGRLPAPPHRGIDSGGVDIVAQRRPRRPRCRHRARPDEDPAGHVPGTRSDARRGARDGCAATRGVTEARRRG